MPTLRTIAPCFWFDHQAEEAARFYVSVFDNSSIDQVSLYSDAGLETHGREPGSVMMVTFTLDGHPFAALNGGTQFRFNEAISFQIYCETQEEVDHFWDKLSEGGDPAAQQCGWLKDRYGVSWQVVPTLVPEVLGTPGPRAERMMAAVMEMKKLDVAALRRAADGE